MNYDRKPKRLEQSLTLPYHLRGLTLFICRIISSTHIHFLIPVLIIDTQSIFTCSSGSVCRWGSWGTRSAQELSTASSRLALRECFPLILQWSPSPFPLWPLHGPCSFRSLKDNARFSKKRGKKRASVSKHCLFAGGMSKKKHLINQNRQERRLFFRELAYLSSLTPSFPSSLLRLPK